MINNAIGYWHGLLYLSKSVSWYLVLTSNGVLNMRTHNLYNQYKGGLYQVWSNMKSRCYNSNSKRYKYYGARGITVCDRWINSFKNFHQDMSSSYQKGLQLDRIDTNGHYSPENCRWVTLAENNRNKRMNIKFNGECASEASRRLGGKINLVTSRLGRGWSMEDAFNKPILRGTVHDKQPLTEGEE